MLFTAPFRYGQQHPVQEHADVIYGLAVRLFSAGFALKTLADLQLEKHKRERKRGLYCEGSLEYRVASEVRLQVQLAIPLPCHLPSTTMNCTC